MASRLSQTLWRTSRPRFFDMPMKTLEPYARHFDRSYSNYEDARYKGLLDLVARYDSPSARQLLASAEFKAAIAMIEPLIEIKNYKSQVPFPRDVVATLECIADMRSSAVLPGDPLRNYEAPVLKLLEIEGFQLPTVSAVLHFCHPASFPIVDVNVQAACKLMQSRYPLEFEGLTLPKLPWPQAKTVAKLESYRCFIRFLSKVVEAQRVHTLGADFRFVDKALMVLGVDRLRAEVETASAP